jgi:hypothetical protein
LDQVAGLVEDPHKEFQIAFPRLRGLTEKTSRHGSQHHPCHDIGIQGILQIILKRLGLSKTPVVRVGTSGKEFTEICPTKSQTKPLFDAGIRHQQRLPRGHRSRR